MRHTSYILILVLTLVASWLPLHARAAEERATPANTRMSIAEDAEPASARSGADAGRALERARHLVTQLPDDGSALPADSPESKPLGAAAERRAPEIENRSLGTGHDGDHSGSAAIDGNNEWILSTLTALGLVLGLVFLLRWGVTKLGGRAATPHSQVVEVLSRTSVAPKNHVLLVRVGGRVLVVGDSPQGLRTLSEIEDPEEVASLLQSVQTDRESSITSGFNKMLSRYTGAYSQRDLLKDEGADRTEARMDRARDSVSSLLGRVRTMAGRGAGP